MAHQIEQMAYVGATPWHGLGNNLPQKQPIEVWQREAGMDWQILESPVHFKSDAIGHLGAGNLLGLAVFIALPSVILTLIYGQTRIFFAMSRDGLLPAALNKVHPRFQTPHVVTLVTGFAVVLGAAFFPVGQLADISNSGTLFAFLVVSLAVMLLRRREPDRKRPFRTPLVWLVGPASVVGCVVLFFYLPISAQLVFPAWGAIGLAVYLWYGRRRSPLRR